MGIAALLADLTVTPDRSRGVPDFLSRTLGLESLTLLVVRHDQPQECPEAVFCASSGPVATGYAHGEFQRAVLDIYRQAGDGGTCWEVAVERLSTFPRAAVFARNLDDAHRMLLIVHRRAGDAALPSGLAQDLLLIALELAKQMRCLIVWQGSPHTLGPPFETLTAREWAVLCGLNSDMLEKQIAVRMDLSPHTLHSHVKSIYRKLGVQGRLPLINRMHAAIHHMRSEMSGRHQKCLAS